MPGPSTGADAGQPCQSDRNGDRTGRVEGVDRPLRYGLLFDEIYHGLSYDDEETTALSLTDGAVVINSFSKYYCMTGWRVGWMVSPPDAVRSVERAAQSLYISAPELSQTAACAVFDATKELEQVKDTYRRNGALLKARLPEIGFTIASPMDGAFYAYVDASKFTNNSI